MATGTISKFSLDPISTGIDILEKLGVLEAVKNKLINNPDKAAAKLELVFVELRKAYEALDEAIAAFCGLSFNTQDGRHDALEFLNTARGGKLQIEMLEAKGNCAKIKQIYDRHLVGWFNRVLDRQESLELESLFDELGSSDTAWVGMLDRVALQFQEIADQMLSYTDHDDFEAAQSLQKELAKDLRKYQDRLILAFRHLYELRLSFSSMRTD